MLHMLQFRSTHGYDQVLHVLQNLNVCITGFIFVFILNVGSENKLLIHVEKQKQNRYHKYCKSLSCLI